MKQLFTQHLVKSFLILLSLGVSDHLIAQPSGGPYGPITQTYEVPDANRVYYVSPDGNEGVSGRNINKPTTIEAAIKKVETGDAIILRGGVYRTGDLVFNQGITLQPYQDERPILKGTHVVKEGVEQRGGEVWRIPWDKLFPSRPLDWWRRDREGVLTPLHRFNNDMVFANGKSLLSVGWEGDVDENTYYIDYDKKQVYVGVNPAENLVELTAYGGALIRVTTEVNGKTNDKKGPTIKGITFTQYAWRAIEIEGKRSFGPTEEPTDEPLGPSDPATYGKEVTGTFLENVTITHCSRVAGFFRGDSLTIRQSLFSDTSTEGVYVIGSSDVLLEGNIFRRNNVEKLTGYYPSAVKIFNQSHRVTCRNNLVMDNPNSSGIWYDVGNNDGVFVNNWVQDCINGFFFEISNGARCVGNVFLNNTRGIFILNSADVKVWHNTFINSPANFGRTNRQAGDHFGWHAATGPDVSERKSHVFVGNLLIADEHFTEPLLQVWQTGDLCGKLTTSPLEQLDGNVYFQPNDTLNVFTYSPSKAENCMSNFKRISDLQTINSEFETQGKMYNADMRSVIKSPELKNYTLMKPYQNLIVNIPLPAEIKELMEQDSDIRTPGAYQVGE